MTPEVGIGFWCVQRCHSRPVPLAAMYADTRAEMTRADQLGFDTVWVGEHHFSYDGYLPSPLCGLAYGAAHLRSARPAAGVLVLPMHSPGRIAAGVAALRGTGCRPPRLAFGLGYRDDELRTIGIDPADRVRTFVRHLDELLGGEHDAELGDAQLWLGGSADAMVARAARRGLSIVVPGNNGARGVARAAAVHAEHLRPRAGVDARIGVIKEVWIEDDPRRLAEARERLRSMWRHYSTYWVDGSPDDPDRAARREQVVGGITGKAVLGSAEQVLDELAALVEAGAGTVACRVRFDSTESGRVLDVMERLAAHVLPELRQVSSAAGVPA
jgi:alkanesulfonate monooxygenase SsuD/methylene tetrahydromethanopterin reductase-like flavin-dependent oxidoreductase (luciferase family)